MTTLNLAGGVLNTFNYILETIKGTNSIGDTRDKVLNDLGKNRVVFKAGGSIMQIISPYMIEPMIVISKDLKNEDSIEDIVNLNVDMFASIYTQAFSIMTNIHGIDGSFALDMLTKRGGPGIDIIELDKTYNKTMAALEDDSFLPIKEETITLEAKRDRTKKEKRLSGKVSDTGFNKDIYGIVSKEIILTINAKKSMKMKDEYEEHQTKHTIDGPKTATEDIEYVIEIPITVRANIIYTNSQNIINMVNTNSDKYGFLNRVEDYRSGAIGLSDLIFASDLVDKYKNRKLKDESDLISIMESRATSANLKLFSKGSIGLTKYFAMLVINNQDKARIEYELRGKIEKSKSREQLFEQTKSMMLTVVDTDWERINMYLQDINGKTDITFKKLGKRAKKDDTGEILKAIFANRPPVL